MSFSCRKSFASLTMGMLAWLAMAGPVSASQSKAPVADRLSELKSTAYAMRVTTDNLKSFTPAKQLHWQSHAHNLEALKSQVNAMGKSLSELEGLKAEANPSQTLAIEQARPHLVTVAENLEQAIELIREDRNNVYWNDYAETVNNMQDHAESLYTKLDTILDYEYAKAQLDGLELQPASTK